MKTAITALLNIQYPIILTGMSWISTPELVAAVSNAGGLGILALGPLTAEQTKAAILRVRELTHKPFGVNCALMMPSAKENAQIALDLHVPVINFSLGKGDWLIKACHAYGGKAIATVTTAKHALAAQRQGADAVMVTGHEAAAHGGEVCDCRCARHSCDCLWRFCRSTWCIGCFCVRGRGGGDGVAFCHRGRKPATSTNQTTSNCQRPTRHHLLAQF